MSGLVGELQRKALDRTCSISDLLRHGLLTARKLRVAATSTWINAELSGYGAAEADVPAYRKVHGEPLARNPYRGWIPIRMPTPELALQIGHVMLPNKVAELEEYVSSDDNSHIYLAYPTNRAYLLGRILDTDWNVALRIPKSSIVGIIDEVRNKLLDWAILLEEQGVHGDGLSFTEKEVEAARTVVNLMTTNNYSNINNSQIQHQSNSSNQTLSITPLAHQGLLELTDKIKRELAAATIPASLRDELMSDIEVVNQQLESPKAKPGIIRAALESFSTSLGSAAASGVVAQAHEWVGQVQSWLSTLLSNTK
ncbi:hypothetical protein [Ralstonia solanacearum]|uniref:AbiTii domain-containing protein n=1 Tax=Ralstonia solanacearum TaxID=305 RepID=A0AAE3NHK4_RALSL|nr:hypothetical protein [Ralstonia solanacearum]MBB6580548.1 hypothetical protein [Ralstonia solanacearum]MDB0523822.1 hypothetical protein [Ralstonia solanacearum]